MATRVDFYYGIGSRYSYLASTRVEALERDTACTVVWRPLVSGMLMERRGMQPFRQATPPSGQYDWTYRRYDAECWATYYNIPYKEPEHGVMEYKRFALACAAADRLGGCAAFSRALFAAVFNGGRDDLDDNALKAIADGAGLDGAALARMIDAPETAAAHERNIDDALAAGAFGVPTFACDGRLFWGNDRLVLLRDFLTRSDPNAYPRRAP